ncbi:MAG: LysR family transcriptional regulator [Gemmatimonadaceae bacterium]|nr:LysR family transcriptional regulator [Acetobacteraceae bacterium]
MQGSGDGSRLEEIGAFAAVAESGSFAAAAKRLGRDASVLSRRVAALEIRLGIRLLARTTRRMALTEAGSAYLRRVQALLAELAAADAEAADRAAAPRGMLRLALPAAFGRMWVAPLLPGFLAAHPAIRVEVQHSDRYVDLVANGIDAAIRVGTLPDSGLVARRLAPFRRLLCASPAYLSARGTPNTPEGLARHACLGFTGHRIGPDWPLRRGSERVTVRTSGPLMSDDGEALAAAAVGGAGIMLAADWLIGRELADGRLVEVLPGWSEGDSGGVHAVLPPGRLVPAKTRVFVDWVAAAFAPVAPWSRSP